MRPVILVLLSLFGFSALQAAPPLDLILENGKIIDGTGAPWYSADLAIHDGRIAAIGRLKNRAARRRIDVNGKVVAPGFIDMMGQTGVPFLAEPKSALNLLTQGITTINAGEGHSPAPQSKEAGHHWGWTTMAEYFQLLEMKGLPLNVAQTVGHTEIRRFVLGDTNAKPNPEQLAQMQAHVHEAMQAGAIGLSTALIYPPATYADESEIAALASVAGEYGGRYYTHMRNEGDRLLEAIDEALSIGRTANTPVHIFHLKAAGEQNWQSMQDAIDRIKAARAAGQQVAADMYPYINNGLGIDALIHPRHSVDGHAALLAKLDDPKSRKTIRAEMETGTGWENWYRHMGSDWNKLVIGRARLGRYSRFAGKTLEEIASALGEDPWDTFFSLAKTGVFVLPQTMSEGNKERLLQEEFISFCTDFGPKSSDRSSSHPRAYGAFPRLLAHYVRDRKVISLERAIAKASAVAANEIMAYDRGRIAVGLAADIVVFDPDSIADHATFASPKKLSTGVTHVLVNGQLVLEDGKQSDARPGRVLRGPGFDPDTESGAVATGNSHPAMAPFDRLMQNYIQRHRIPGAALAVLDHGRLVHARGYGYADVATREKATADSRFRIASISKMITGAAIMKLVEEDKLTLENPVFELFDPGAQLTDPRQKNITIDHLLRHRGGWDRNAGYDPMFESPRIAKALGTKQPASATDIIRFMSGVALDFEPGKRMSYSNYGYNLLGRVIEKLSGQPYEAYVQEQVLAPLGITGMQIGRTLPEHRAEDEVRYYDPSRGESIFPDTLGTAVHRPYGAWNLEAMDAHGAWIASVTDLARYARAFMPDQENPVLTQKSIDTIFSPPAKSDPAKVQYGLGWFIRHIPGKGFNYWHTGSLGGTAALVVLRHDQRAWVVLFNARVSPLASHLTREIDPLLHEAANTVRDWPRHDLFRSPTP